MGWVSTGLDSTPNCKVSHLDCTDCITEETFHPFLANMTTLHALMSALSAIFCLHQRWDVRLPGVNQEDTTAQWLSDHSP